MKTSKILDLMLHVELEQPPPAHHVELRSVLEQSAKIIYAIS